MGWLEHVRCFFSTLSAGEWVSSGLALAAIVVSIVALRHTKQPRPSISSRTQWELPFTNPDPTDAFNEVELIDVMVLNRGAGSAFDVVVSFPDAEQSQPLGTIGTDMTRTASFNSRSFQGDAPYKYVVSWREYPPSKGRSRKVKGAATVTDPTTYS